MLGAGTGTQLGAADLPFLVAELSGYCNEYDTHTFLTHCKYFVLHNAR